MSFTIRLGDAPVTCAGGASTRVYVLLGHPVAHSRSPAMQNAAFHAAGLDAVYVACDVAPRALHSSLEQLRELATAGRIAGANVTVPHKQAILPDLDALEPDAALAGAVNTLEIRRDEGGAVKLQGHNTDVTGLVSALAETGASFRGARVVIVGAGGMARAAVVAALHEGARELRVCNRDIDRAQSLLDDIAAAWRGALPHLACAPLVPETGELLAAAEVLVQATPLGLHATDPLPISLEHAASHLVVIDAAYTHGGTGLVRAARARGLRADDGHGLLLHQGAAAFGVWTGQPAPLDAMRRALTSAE